MRIWAFVIAMTLSGCVGPVQDSNAESKMQHLPLNGDIIDLTGDWHWSIDPYGDGYSGFHGGEAGYGSRRYNYIDVEAEMREDPSALFEYDMQNAKLGAIPGSWINHEPQMRHYQGIVWYLREFNLQPVEGERLFLEFGAVNYRADVYLNGEHIGEHEGGFTPFIFEITGKVVAGPNALTVGVDSRRDEQSVPPPVTDWETYGGITRPVKILRKPQTFIADAWVRLSPDGKISVEANLDGASKARASIQLRIPELDMVLPGMTDADGVWHAKLEAPTNLKRWSPNTPFLYEVVLESAEDSWRDKIGFRTIEVVGEDILLNGEPVFLRGISVHEEEIGADPNRNITEKDARALLSEVKDGLNGNFVRLAHYPHSDVMTRMADEMGLIVWSEIPVYWRIDWRSAQTLDVAKNMLGDNIMRDRNRASIMFWSVANETPISDARNRFLGELVETVRALDTTRLVTAALLTSKARIDGVLTGRIEDPLTDQLDVLSINTYDGWYGSVPVSEISEIRWDLPFNKPIIISEFGAGAFLSLSGEDIPRKFSVEYQSEIYREMTEMSVHMSALRGLSPWILKDFRSPRRQHSIYQNGWNRKGLLTETGERKPAFMVLSNHYAKLEVAASE